MTAQITQDLSSDKDTVTLASSQNKTPNMSQTMQNDQARINEIVGESGTSFFWAMRLLPKERREAIFAVYAFCREVDDIADEEGRDQDKRVALDVWRSAIRGLYEGTKTEALDENMNAILSVLSTVIPEYDLEEADFQAVIDGMEMDAHGPVALTDMDALDFYCDRVASAVGRLCVPIFGQADAKGREVANHLGRALQLTNIIRDVPEDAKIDRLYLPQDLLAKYGMSQISPHEVAQHVNLPQVCAELGVLAETRYVKATEAIAECNPKAMRAPNVMMKVYYQNLKRLRRAEWQPLTLLNQNKIKKISSKLEKLIIGLRYGFL